MFFRSRKKILSGKFFRWPQFWHLKTGVFILINPNFEWKTKIKDFFTFIPWSGFICWFVTRNPHISFSASIVVFFVLNSPFIFSNVGTSSTKRMLCLSHFKREWWRQNFNFCFFNYIWALIATILLGIISFCLFPKLRKSI